MSWPERIAFGTVAAALVLGWVVLALIVVDGERRSHFIEHTWACAIHGECRP